MSLFVPSCVKICVCACLFVCLHAYPFIYLSISTYTFLKCFPTLSIVTFLIYFRLINNGKGLCDYPHDIMVFFLNYSSILA